VSRTTDEYWFRAKRYGWGWGLPVRREGWLVLAGYLIITVGLAAAPVFFGDSAGPVSAVGVIAATFVFVAICYRTGEPPSGAGRR
jgi:hypothetical protein